VEIKQKPKSEAMNEKPSHFIAEDFFPKSLGRKQSTVLAGKQKTNKSLKKTYPLEDVG